MITILPYNETHVKIRTSDFGIEQELNDFFSFFAPGYRYMPMFKKGMWDGKVKLYSMRYKTIYKGLINVVERFCKTASIECIIHDDLKQNTDISVAEVSDFMHTLKLPREPRDYQIEATHHALSKERCVLLSATSSGKSLIIYSLIRKFQDEGKRTLLIVPNINLVKQMYSDFVDYSQNNGWDVLEEVHALYSGQERVFEAPVIISTWQTLLSMIKKDPERYKELTDCVDALIGDEAHALKSGEVSKVIEGFTKTKIKIGTTGTIDDKQVNELTLAGLFGPVYKVISAKELIDAGHATDVQVRVINLRHPEHIRKAFKGMKYPEEVQHIMACNARNKFIARLAMACKGNTLILYNQVLKHGDLIHRELEALLPDGRKLYYVHGGVDADEREQIRQIVEHDDSAIILATSSLMSTGTNIPSIENIIFAMGGKSINRIRQSIGRGLRLKDGKSLCKVFDLCDDFRYKSYENTAFKHMNERIQIYAKEQFDYTFKEFDLEY